MGDVVKKRCRHGGCTKISRCGVAGGKKKEFCFKHAAEGMVHLASQIQPSGNDRSGGGGLRYGSSAATGAGAGGTALTAAPGKKRRACPPSPTQAETCSGNPGGGVGDIPAMLHPRCLRIRSRSNQRGMRAQLQQCQTSRSRWKRGCSKGDPAGVSVVEEAAGEMNGLHPL